MHSEKTKNLETVSINFLAAAGTDSGRQRPNNEDRFVFDVNCGFFSVIDGMGGHAGGETASLIAAETMQNAMRRIDNSAPVRLRDSVILANNNIRARAQEKSKLRGMGCVLTALLIEGELATVAHVGDTRLYKIQDGKIEKLTADHSPVGEIEEKGDFSEIGLMRHPRRNEVSRCLGLSEKKFDESDFIDVFQINFLPEAAFLLCSDGLSDLLTTDQIFEAILDNNASPAAIVESLIDEANQAGGKDNITVIFVAGSKFREAAANAGTNHKKKSAGQRIGSLIFNRWTFLLYGLFLGAALAVWYYYRHLPASIESP